MIPDEQYYLKLLATILKCAVEITGGFTFLELYAMLLEYEFSDVWQMVNICIQSGTFSNDGDGWFDVNHKDDVRVFLKAIEERKNNEY